MLQAEDGIRGLVRSRGLGDVYKRQAARSQHPALRAAARADGVDKPVEGDGLLFGGIQMHVVQQHGRPAFVEFGPVCLLYTSDAADDLLCVGFGGRRIFKKKKQIANITEDMIKYHCT